MIKFPDERLHKISVDNPHNKHPIPVVYAEPINKKDNSCVFIFVGGLHATNSFNVYMNSFAFDENYFITYDKLAHGENKNKPSQYKKPYILELDCVVDWARKQFSQNKIYLIGESWGAAIDFVYYKKYKNKINGVFAWNMPTKVVNTQKKSAKETWSLAWRELLTILTNHEFDLPLDVNHRNHLSRNKLLLRVLAMQSQRCDSSKSTLSVWRFMGPSRRFLINNCNNPDFNFMYIQSGQDALMTKKHIDKIKKKADAKHFKMFDTGFHILCMEEIEGPMLYQELKNFVNQK